MKWMSLMKEYSMDKGPGPLIEKTRKGFKEYGIYPDSIQVLGDTLFFLVRRSGEKLLALYGSEELFDRFEGEEPVTARNCCEKWLGVAKPVREEISLTFILG